MGRFVTLNKYIRVCVVMMRDLAASLLLPSPRRQGADAICAEAYHWRVRDETDGSRTLGRNF